jgi:hypothetical protein
VRGIREIRLQFSHLSYLGGEAIQILGRDSRGCLGLGHLPARTALHLVGADDLRLRTLHIRGQKAVGTDSLQRTKVSRVERGGGATIKAEVTRGGIGSGYGWCVPVTGERRRSRPSLFHHRNRAARAEVSGA